MCSSHFYSTYPALLLSSNTASEWKYFLLYYIPVTLYGILLDVLYVHILLLVKAIRLLLGSRVSKEDIEVAEKLLKKFCKLMEEYYG
jgi:hypothetical protein